MKFFDEYESEKRDTVIQQPKVEFQKRGLLGSVGDFTVEVLNEIERWLYSFPTGMTKDAFARQMSNLDSDPKIAMSQLRSAYGFRVIKRHRETFPFIDKSFMQCIASDLLFLSIMGKRKDCESYVINAIKDLRNYGNVYVLDCAVLFADFKSARERGNADSLLSEAQKCDFLIIENLDQPIGYVSNVAIWALISTVNVRVELKKPILSRYNSYKNLNPIYEKCPVHSVSKEN